MPVGRSLKMRCPTNRVISIILGFKSTLITTSQNHQTKSDALTYIIHNLRSSRESFSSASFNNRLKKTVFIMKKIPTPKKQPIKMAP